LQALRHTTEILNQTSQAINTYYWVQQDSQKPTYILQLLASEVSWKCQESRLLVGVFCLQAWQYLRAVFLAIDFSGGTL